MQESSNAGLVGQTVWDRVAASAEFRQLILRKKNFIIPAFLFFLGYYFLLPLLVGYTPKLMSRKVWGDVNLAYLFALSQFFMAWIIAWLYIRAATKFDAMAKNINADALKPQGSGGDN